MNQDQDHKGDFEARLLAELRTVVAGREPVRDEAEGSSFAPGWRRGPRLALAGGAVTAVAAAALVIGAGGGDTPAAYAVTHEDDGNLSVEIRRLGDPGGLQGALAAAGVPAEVEYVPSKAALPTEEACGTAPAHTSKGVEATLAPAPDAPARLTVDPGKVGPGEKLVLTAAPADGRIAVETEVARVEPDSVAGIPAKGAGEGDGAGACAAPAGADAAVPGAPAVPAAGEGDTGTPAGR